MKKQAKTFEALHYWQMTPDDFSEDKTYPLLLVLHGAGSRGSDMTLLRTNPYFQLTESTERQLVSVVPQCYANTWFDVFEQLQRLVCFAVELPYVDKNRVYVMGPSMGGYGTWQLAMSMPEVFAAAVPICGGGMYWNADRLKDMPIWAWHGEGDRTVYPEESQKMVDAVNRGGGHATLTLCKGVEHNSWINAYTCPEVFEWLLAQVKGQPLLTATVYDDPTKFG